MAQGLVISPDEVISFALRFLRPFDSWPGFPSFVHTDPASQRKDIRSDSRPETDSATLDESRQPPADEPQ